MKHSLQNIFKLKERGVISIIGAGGKTTLMFQLAKELADSGKTVLTTTTTKIFMPCPEQSPDTIIADSFDELVEKLNKGLTRFNHLSAGSEQIQANGKLKGFDPDVINRLWQSSCFDWIIVESDGAKQKSLKATDLHEPVVPEVTTHLILVTGLDVIGKILCDKYVHRAGIFSKNTALSPGGIIDEQSIAISTAIEIKKAADPLTCALNFIFLNKADNMDRLKSGQLISKFFKKQKFFCRIIIASLKDGEFIKKYYDIQKE